MRLAHEEDVRKQPDAMYWSVDYLANCASFYNVNFNLNAITMLADNCQALVYSTCTWAPERMKKSSIVAG